MSKMKRPHRVPINRQTLTLFVRMVRDMFASDVGTADSYWRSTGSM